MDMTKVKMRTTETRSLIPAFVISYQKLPKGKPINILA